jgi:hypothetical protein
MKKLLLIALMMLAGSAWAEWVLVTKNSANSEFYLDRSTIKKDGNKRKVWILLNFGKPENKKESEIIREEYDCAEEQAQFLYVSTHSAPMGKGKLIDVYEYKEPNWGEIPPSSPFRDILNIVCSK